MSFIKNFVDWFKLKPKLDESNYNPPLFKEREIWWCHLGENIGTEVSGKGSKYTRPVIIFKKLSKYTFLGIPTTTQLFDQKGTERIGSWYEKIEIKNIKMLAVLSQVKIIDYRRLDDKIARLDDSDFAQIGIKFNQLYQYQPKNMPPKREDVTNVKYK